MCRAEVEYDDWLPLLDKWQTSVKKGARERGDLRIKAVWYGPDLVSNFIGKHEIEIIVWKLINILQKKVSWKKNFFERSGQSSRATNYCSNCSNASDG